MFLQQRKANLQEWCQYDATIFSGIITGKIEDSADALQAFNEELFGKSYKTTLRIITSHSQPYQICLTATRRRTILLPFSNTYETRKVQIFYREFILY